MKKYILGIFISCIIIFFSCSSSKKTADNPLKEEDYLINAMMIDGVTALNNDNISKAESIFKDVLNKDKNNSAAMYYMAVVCFAKQDYTSSVDYAAKSVKANPSNVWNKLQLSQIYLALQDYNSAAKTFEQIVKQYPSEIDYWQQLASIYHVKNDHKGELDCLDRMEKRFGVSEITSMQKFNLYRANGDNVKAAGEIENLVKAFPSNTDYLSMLAELKMKDNKYDEAFACYNKIKELNPLEENLNFTFANYYMVKNNQDSLYYYLSKAVVQPNIDYATKINIIFSVYENKVDTDDTVFNRFFSLLKLMSATDDSVNCQLWGLMNVGYMRVQNYDSVVYCCKKAIDGGCTDYDTYRNLLFAKSTASEPQEMVDLCDEVLELYPEQPMPYLFKGVNLSLMAEYEKAVEVLLQGERKAGRDYLMKEDFYMNLGDCYHALGKNAECFKYYDKVLEINSDNYAVLNNYAYYLCLEKKDLDRALGYAEKVIEKFPDNSTFVDTYAWILYQKGEYLKAKQSMDKVLKSKNDWSKEQNEHYSAILQKLK